MNGVDFFIDTPSTGVLVITLFRKWITTVDYQIRAKSSL